MSLPFYLMCPIYFWAYEQVRPKYPARHERLFMLSYCMSFICNMASWIFFSAFLYVMSAAARLILSEAFCFVCLLFEAALTGYFLRCQHRLKPARLRYLQIHPEPRFQIWLQDIFVATFVFGVWMLWVRATRSNYDATENNFWMIGRFILINIAGFMAAVDVCRVSLKLQQSRARMLFVALVMIACPLFTSYFGVTLLVAWWVWRQGVWRERFSDRTTETPDPALRQDSVN